MNSADFQKLQTSVGIQTSADSLQVDRKSPERQARLAELKEQVSSGSYKVNLAKLAESIHASGTLDNVE